MTNWTLETLEDFDGVFFDAGMGWKVLFEIHLAISLRNRYVGGASTNFNTQISGIVWTDDDSADDNRDLKTELQHCYNAIAGIMSSPQTEFGGHHWTHTSGRSEVWTIESMTADIGMGEFEDLLVRTQSPEPLVWLIAALNRMQHLKLWKTLTFNDLFPLSGSTARTIATEDLFLGRQTDVHDDDETRMQQAWTSDGFPLLFPDIMGSTPNAGWEMADSGAGFPIYETRRISKATNITLHPTLISGPQPPAPSKRRTELSVRCLDYIYRLVVFGYDGPDFVVKIGSAPETNIGHAHTNTSVLVLESEGPDLDFGGTDHVDLELITPPPSDVPFIVFNRFDPRPRISVIVSNAWVYCDIPQIMGAGELTAPKPTVSATAEQEE